MKKHIFWLLISTSTLVGCGQTGPLYLPSADVDQERQDKPRKKSGELPKGFSSPTDSSR